MLDVAAVETLLMAGADPDARDVNGVAPLYFATYSYHQPVSPSSGPLPLPGLKTLTRRAEQAIQKLIEEHRQMQ